MKLLAFAKDNKTVLIVINDTDDEKTVTVPLTDREITVATTDMDNNLAESKTKNADIKISAKSVNTIMF